MYISEVADMGAVLAIAIVRFCPTFEQSVGGDSTTEEIELHDSLRAFVKIVGEDVFLTGGLATVH